MIARPSKRQSRSVLIWGFVFLAMFAAIGELCLPTWLGAQRDPRYSIRRDRLQQRLARFRVEHPGKQPRLVVVLGSSRMFNGIDGEAMERELRAKLGDDICLANFATPGAGPFLNFALLGRLLREDVKPDLVIVEALPKFFDITQPNAEAFLPGYVTMCPGDEAWMKQHNIPIDLSKEDPNGWAIFTYRNEVLRNIAPQLLPRAEQTQPHQLEHSMDAWGSGLVQGHFDADRRSAGLQQARKEYLSAYQHAQWGGAGEKVLRCLLTECRQRQIATMVVLPPEGSTMRSWYRPGAIPELEAHLNQVVTDCDSTLVVASEWMEEADFIDSHHLLGASAQKFSARLGRDAVGPWLEQRVATNGKSPTRR